MNQTKTIPEDKIRDFETWLKYKMDMAKKSFHDTSVKDPEQRDINQTAYLTLAEVFTVFERKMK